MSDTSTRSDEERSTGSGSDLKTGEPGLSPAEGLQAGGADVKAPQATLELPLLDLPSAHPCHGCGECCDYVAVEIDKPTAFRDYDHIFWYLAHKRVIVYVDWEGGWFLEFETPCEHMTPGRTCGIYEQRPYICSSFSWEECEKNTQERAWKYRFRTPDEFFEWLHDKRPRSFERYTKKRRQMIRERSQLRKRKEVITRSK